MMQQLGGGSGIRTRETVARPADFESAAFNHSATPVALRRKVARSCKSVNSRNITSFMLRKTEGSGEEDRYRFKGPVAMALSCDKKVIVVVLPRRMATHAQ